MCGHGYREGGALDRIHRTTASTTNPGPIKPGVSKGQIIPVAKLLKNWASMFWAADVSKDLV
jgi:hypothetical protein